MSLLTLRRPGRAGTRVRPILLGVLGVVLLGVIWEAYKALGPANGFVVNGLTVLPLQ